MVRGVFADSSCAVWGGERSQWSHWLHQQGATCDQFGVATSCICSLAKRDFSLWNGLSQTAMSFSRNICHLSKGPGRYTRESAHHPELLVGLLQRGRVLVGWVMVCWKVPWKRYQIIIKAGWGEITDNTEMKYCIIPWVFCLTTEHSHCSRWQSFWAQHLDERKAAALPGDLTFGGRWHHWWHLDEIFEWLELGSFCSQKFNNHINHDSLKSAKIHDFKVRSDLERNVADTEARLKNDIRQKQQEAGSSVWSKLSLIQTPKSSKNELRPLRRLVLSNSKQSWGVAWRTRDFFSVFFLSIGGQLLKVWVLLFLMYEIQDLCSISNFSLSEG